MMMAITVLIILKIMIAIMTKLIIIALLESTLRDCETEGLASLSLQAFRDNQSRIFSCLN